MKNLLLGLLFISLFLSCTKEDNCDNTSLATTLIGEWTVSTFGVVLGDVEFLTDGTLIDVDNVLLSDELAGGPVENKTYIVQSDTLMTLQGIKEGQMISFDFQVLSFSCSEVQVKSGLFPGRLRRK